MSQTPVQPRQGLLLSDRYVVQADDDQAGPSLAEGFDEVLRRPVSLLMMPVASSISDRLALRLQLRRTFATALPGLAEVFDVVDSSQGLAVVIARLPGARLLSEVGQLPVGAVAELRRTLTALHATGTVHGAVSSTSIAVTPDGGVVLLPVPTRTASSPADDLRAVDEVAAYYEQTTPPPKRTAALAQTSPLEKPAPHDQTAPIQAMPAPTSTADLTEPVPLVLAVSGDAPELGSEPPSAHRRASLARLAVIAAGGFAGALAVDVLTRLLG